MMKYAQLILYLYGMSIVLKHRLIAVSSIEGYVQIVI